MPGATTAPFLFGERSGRGGQRLLRVNPDTRALVRPFTCRFYVFPVTSNGTGRPRVSCLGLTGGGYMFRHNDRPS